MQGLNETTMASIILEDMKDNGQGAQFNRDLFVGHMSTGLQDKETELADRLLPRIEAANAAAAEGKITETQRDLIVNSATRQLERQAALNDRIMNKRR